MIDNLRSSLNRLSIYRQLGKDPVLQCLAGAVDAGAAPAAGKQDAINFYQEAVFHLWERGYSFTDHILDQILFADNPFTRLAERGPISTVLRRAVQVDLAILHDIFHLDLTRLGEQIGITGVNLPQTIPGRMAAESEIARELKASDHWPDCLDKLIVYHSRYFRGVVARYPALRWDSRTGLVGIEHPDPIGLKDLVGYQSQIQQVCENTEKFLHGYPANHILLYGPRGTGKSSLIKALRRQYWREGLRLVELARDDLGGMNRVVETLQDYAARFILFIDDLSFEDDETQYKGFKAALEGSLQCRPANMLVYATSNRRHLIREYFSDRQLTDEEIHGQETMQEKLSLADRFGLTITFPVPGQQLYLEMVEKMAREQGIEVDPELLRRRALEWERLRHGPSGRSARQFVDSLAEQVYKPR